MDSFEDSEKRSYLKLLQRIVVCLDISVIFNSSMVIQQ